MTLIHTVGAQNACADAVVDLCDVGATDPGGDLRFRTSGDAEVAILALTATTAFGAAAAGIATASAITDDTNATGGTIANFILQDRANAEVLEGTVTVTSGGGDIELSSIIIGAGDTISMTSLTYDASAF